MAQLLALPVSTCAGAGRTRSCPQRACLQTAIARSHTPDYDNRVLTHDRAMRAGLDDVGLGTLFGLYDYKYEVRWRWRPWRQ